jgi:hypothetical protein
MSFQNAADALFKGVNKTFSTQATYTYAADSSTSDVEGVFENGFIEIQGVVDQRPLFKNLILSTLTADPVQGDTILINSRTYTVETHQPDGLGTTTLILRE